jgi:drug/metabolite transporter superfamily protein YnfA
MTAERVPLSRWTVRGLLLFVLAFANLHDIWSPDVVPNTLFAWTLIHQGNVDYDEFTDRRPPGHRMGLIDLGIPPETYFFRPCGSVSGVRTYTAPGSPRSAGGPPPPGPGDHVCSIFPPGISLLALPILAPFVLAGVPPGDGAALVRLGHLAAALIEVLAALLLWSVLRRFASARWSLALVLLYATATSVRTVASQALWQHSGVHLALAFALWLVLIEGRVTPRRELLAGLVMGFGTVVRQTTGLIAIGLARLPWPISVVRPLAPIAFAVGWAIGVVPLLVYDQIAFGSPLEQGYGDKPFNADIGNGLYGLLLSPSRGVLIYEPWIVAALIALAIAWRSPGHVALRLRGLSVAWLVLLYTYARYAEWWGGRVFGPRFLDDLAPALIAALAWGISRGLLAATWARVAFWLAAAWSLLLFNAAAFVFDPSGWDLNVNFDQSRLYSWADPQWLAVLGALAAADRQVMLAALLNTLLLAILLRLELRRV